jgi:superfamily II DNA or RNA helicase
MTDNTKEFLQKLKDSGHWNDDYDYSKVEYINNSTKVIVIDKNNNTEHLIRPGDLLRGSKCVGKNLKEGFLPFNKAREFVRSLNLKSQTEWGEYRKSVNKPNNIPSNPNKIYKNEWISMGDFLGTLNISTQRMTFLPFEDAKKFVRGLNIKSETEWRKFKKSGKKPNNIPSTPENIYKDEWLSWGDFFGYNIGFKEFLSFEEAKEFVRSLNLKSNKEWQEYIKSNNKPNNIPSRPDYQYKNQGWLSYGDFLGYKEGFNGYEYLPFNETKEFVRSLNLKGQKEWREYCKSGNKSNNIPSDPYQVYKNEWISWADFLGYFGDGSHRWTKKYILDFIKSLQSELNNLDLVELITIINSNNLAKKLKELGSLEELISTQGGTQERIDIVNNIITEIEESSDEIISENDNLTENEFENELTEGSVDEITEEHNESELEPLEPIQELRMYDNNIITASLDDENIDFLMKNQLKKLWNKVINNKVDIEQFKNETGGEKFTIIKNWFFDEYNKVIQIEPPSDYIFKYQPNLMQKLITYRLINEKRYGNWSGTGAGKTLSAIFAGRYGEAKNTVIICNNATVEGWVNSIHEYFSNNRIYTKKFLDYTDPKLYSIIDKYDINFTDGENNYLILNYETFQLEDGEFIVSELLKNNRIDYIILDEVQNVKQRDDDESTRRNVVSKLIIHSKEKNEDLLVMVMSATPVINNLTEPKKLIELLTGEIHNELNTSENILNGIEMYKALTRYGLRYIPNYGISVNEELIEIDGQHLSDRIIRIPRGAVVDFERVLIETKLDGIKDKIKKGTLIYTHYVTELSDLIGEYIKDLGFSIGYYTGENKNGLRPFKEGKIDVLIGSAPIGTGVDGIQYVCNTLIPICLPWTSSEYDQLVGRVNRQGSNFDHVNIYIPQVVIDVDDDIWSWDKRRYNIIKFKATLADLAVDGRVPRNLLPPKTRLIEEAQKELRDWVDRLNQGDIITFEREELSIPLNPKLFEKNKNQLGDFSEMNQRWSVTKSENTHNRLSNNPSEWYYYHTLYSEKRKTWSEIPYIEIAKKINVRPDWIVGDFGCGENLLSKEITNKVYAFDHIAIDNSVYSCDIKNVPIEDNVLDAAVFSLSLMGSNYTDYFKEAYRTLKIYGNIFVCEPAKKWEGREDDLKKSIESVGFKCFGAIKNTDKFIYIDGVKY